MRGRERKVGEWRGEERREGGRRERWEGDGGREEGEGEGEKDRGRVKGRKVAENNQFPSQQSANRPLSLTNLSYTHTHIPSCVSHSVLLAVSSMLIGTAHLLLMIFTANTF